MPKPKLRERSDIPLDQVAKVFCKRGYTIGVIAQNEKETMIAVNDECILYLYFPENKDNVITTVEQTLLDKDRMIMLRSIHSTITKNIHDYIKNSHPDESKIHRHNLYVEKVDQFEHVREPEVMEEIAYFDINHAYLQIAYRLGYIKKRSYQKLLDIYPDYKIEICAALMSMAKSTQCTYFRKKSVKSIRRVIDCDYSGIKEIRDNISSTTHLIFPELCESLSIGIFARNVDSVVIPRNEADRLATELDKMKLKYKRFEGKYSGHGMLLQDNCEYYDMGDLILNQQTLHNKD